MDSIKLITRDPVDPARTFEIEAEVSRTPGARRCVILVPPTNGVTFLDRHFLRQLRQKPVHVMALTGFTGAWETTPDWRVHDRGLKRGQCAVLELLAWARRRLRAEKFSVIGLSMGALFAGMAAAKTDEIESLALVVGGAPIYQIAAESWHPALLSIRRSRDSTYGRLRSSAYVQKLRRSIDVDLADVARPKRGRRDLLVIGKNDWIIPTARQYDLARRLKPEKTIEVNGGHLAAMVMAETYYARQIREHLIPPEKSPGPS